MHQITRPHTKTPTTSAAIHDPTHRLVMRSVCSVTPSGIQPRATVSLQPVVNNATATPCIASRSFALFARSPRCECTGGLPNRCPDLGAKLHHKSGTLVLDSVSLPPAGAQQEATTPIWKKDLGF